MALNIASINPKQDALLLNQESSTVDWNAVKQKTFINTDRNTTIFHISVWYAFMCKCGIKSTFYDPYIGILMFRD